MEVSTMKKLFPQNILNLIELEHFIGELVSM